ncbi:MAG: hypothetical protein KJZ93_17500, partial [Caldilineaceae bacterium]|nr:hypothetical protein [Caldilineaceae bacterium]
MLLGLFSAPRTAQAETCTMGACVSSGVNIADVDPQRSELLNALFSALVGEELDLNADAWQAILDGALDLSQLIDQLGADLGLGDVEAVLNTNLTLSDLLNAAAAISPDELSLELLDLSASLSDLNGTIQLGEMLDLSLDNGQPPAVTLNAFDMLASSVQLYNLANQDGPGFHTTLAGADLGIASLGQITLRATAIEAPTIVCDEVGAVFTSAALRIQLDLDGLNLGLDTGDLLNALLGPLDALVLGLLNLDVSATATDLTLYIDMARGEGVIQAIDAVTQAVTLELDPGAANVYLGQIEPNLFADRSHSLTPADVEFADIGLLTVNATVLGLPVLGIDNISAAIRAKSFAEGGATAAQTAHLSPPYPASVSVAAGSGYGDDLVASLVSNLQVQVDTSVLPPALLDLLNTILDGLLGALIDTTTGVAPILDAALSGLVDPLFEAFGVGLGAMSATVHGVFEHCEPPPAPVIETPAQHSITNNQTPTASGTAQPNSVVTVRKGTTTLCQATVGEDGQWNCDSTPLADGVHTIQATAANRGGAGPASPTRTFTVDTLPPAPPLVTAPAASGVISDDTPTFAGVAEPGSQVTVTEGDAALCTATTDGAGAWQCAPDSPLTQGAHTVAASATDAAGNTSAPTNHPFTIDSSAVSTPSILSPTPGAHINQPLPTINGLADAAVTVTVRGDSDILCAAATDDDGVWSCTPGAPLSEGPHTVRAIAVNGAGTESTPATRTFTIDTTPPAPPTISSPAAGSAITETMPVFAGAAEPGSTVAVHTGGELLCTVQADDDASWSCASTITLEQGSWTVMATATDAAGNTSAPSTRAFIIWSPTDDDDGDGIPNGNECPTFPDCPDTDGDGIPDYLDPDDDGDGVPTSHECPNFPACPDTDGDGIPDYLDRDDDGDGVHTEFECPTFPDCQDTDGDGTPDYLDPDDDGDGKPTVT